MSRNSGRVLSEQMLPFWYLSITDNWHSPMEHESVEKVHREDKQGRSLDEVKGCRLDCHDAKRTLDGRRDRGIENWRPHKSLPKIGVSMLIA